jgi:hypothetical protein
MHSRWYPAALSMSIVACGASVDDGKPSATGGSPQFHYGPNAILGGATGIDSGQPLATGGVTPTVKYGVITQNTGGNGATGATSGAGGSSNIAPNSGGTTIDSGVPSTGGYRPIPMYMANLRLPPKDCAAGPDNYYARAFEPRGTLSPVIDRDPTNVT